MSLGREILQSVTFIGLGRIGLPQALVAAEKGYNVYGIDADHHRVEQLTKGLLPFEEPGLKDLLSRNLHRNFAPMGLDQLGQVIAVSDYILFTIGIGSATIQGVDTSNLFSVISRVFESSTKHKVVVILRSTVPLGTTDSIKEFIESRYKLKESQDFYLAFVPERLAEGYAVAEEQELPKMVGAYSDAGFERVEAFLDVIGGKVIRLSSAKAAELAKLVDNSFRNTLFAFANDLAFAAEINNLDSTEISKACNEDYPRNFIPMPGPASGYCLGKDPYILEHAFSKIAQGRRFKSLWFYGRKVNDFLPARVASNILDKMDACNMTRAPKVLVLGLGFKADIDDYRASPSIDILTEVHKAMPLAEISVYDSYLGKSAYSLLPRNIEKFVGEKFTALDPEIFDCKDIIVVATKHREIEEIGIEGLTGLLRGTQNPVIIYDCWNIWRGAEKLNGVIYLSLGYRGSH